MADEEMADAAYEEQPPVNQGDDAGEITEDDDPEPEEEDEDEEVEVYNSDTEEEEGAGEGIQGYTSPNKKEIAKRERARLREQERLKKKRLEDLQKKHNEEAEADSQDPKGRRLKYLLAQTEIFSHFTKEQPEAPSKKKSGRKGRMAEADEDKALLNAAADEQESLVNTRLTVQPSTITGEMREYQLQGLNFLIRLYENGVNGILADEMGLGKTLQTISLLAYLSEFRGIKGPHVVCVPKSTLGNWCNEIRRWCPHLRPLKFHGDKAERARLKEEEMVPGRKWDVCVTSFETIIKEKATFKKFHWRYIIIDEAHRIKNENSRLSQVLRTLKCNNRLLITGTPLQNNLHELWALLNFLLPELFHDSEQFDEWFKVEDGQDSTEVVAQLHKVLRPFLLRRLKNEVEKSLPPKKEIILKVGMSAMQKTYYRMLLQKDIDAINGSGERSRLLNIVMQLRKCCNHPYLFQGAEPEPYCNGEHLVENAGKMVLLDMLLAKMKQRDSRVLIFSQMTRLLDILEDYCLYRGFNYCRIDGNTGQDDRDRMIDDFNRDGSEKFIFLLSTRAGGLGINLATADTVVLYDSDWNPQMDLQAMDRAHRIGQKKEVTVFRFCTDDTIEVKVIEKAYKKLALDALVIQQGRLADQQKNVSKEDLQQMVRFGADKIFNSAESSITEEDIDALISKGEKATLELNSKMSQYTENAMKFSLDGGQVYEFKDEEELAEFEEVEGVDIKTMIGANWVDPPKRERKKNYSETEYYKKALSHTGPKASGPRLKKAPRMEDFQFYDHERIQRLYDIESDHQNYLFQRQADIEAAASAAVPQPPPPEDPNAPRPLTEEEMEERDNLLSQGFASWNKRDFNNFVRACEKWGRDDYVHLTEEVDGKTEEEIKEYSEVFWQRYTEINDYDKYIRNIERGEAKIQRHNDIMDAVGKKLDRYKNPWKDLRIIYGQNKGKGFTEEEDRFLICMIHKLGWGLWDELKAEIRKSHLFRFDWFFKSRTPQELQKRCDQLVRLVEKENEELREKELAQRKAAKKLQGPGAAKGPKGMVLQSSAPGKKRKLAEDAYGGGPMKK